MKRACAVAVLAAAGLTTAVACGGPIGDKIAATCEVKSRDAWFGYARTVFAFDGEEAWVVEPKAG